MELVLICTIFGAFLCISFFLGAKVGQTVVQNKTLEIPTLNPVKRYHEYIKEKEIDREEEKLKTILENIDSYDGTELGQKEV